MHLVHDILHFFENKSHTVAAKQTVTEIKEMLENIIICSYGRNSRR